MSDWELLRELPKVTRVEVTDSSGRAYVGTGLHDVQMSFQDDGRTLKIFVASGGGFSIGKDSQ